MIGTEKARKIEAHVIQEVGHPKPLRFANSWCKFKVDDLSELNNAQARKLVDEATKFVAWARETKAADDKREAARARRRERVEG